jgi:hypothetical protein
LRKLEFLAWFLVLGILFFWIGVTGAIGQERPKSVKPVSVQGLNGAHFQCGYVIAAKDNKPDKFIFVVGEYHKPTDVQEDVGCVMRQLVSTFGYFSFVGKEGLSYDKGATKTSKVPKLNLGIPLIGIEGPTWNYRRELIHEIDDEHTVLAKKKLDGGLTVQEAMAYDHISWQSYRIIVDNRSREWAYNLDLYMTNNNKSTGLINVGLAHLLSLQEAFDAEGISYVMILPNSVNDYCSCESYVVVKHRPDSSFSCKSVCEDNNLKPI